MDKCNKVAALYITTLRALGIIHSQNHWTTNGMNFYGNHLLFERIYKSVLEDLDQAAEKFIGILGQECLDYEFQNKLLNSVLSKYNNLEGSSTEMSLAAEKDFIKLSEGAYQCFESEGKMTLGLDDFLMSTANNHEETIYFLQQVLKK
jgi:DNA-binding ferritin-like protein